LGAHTFADCYSCHPSASYLRFEPVGIECYDCHNTDFAAAKNPDHIAGNFSVNCTDCHSMLAFDWAGAGFDHGFFPLTQGHDIQDCAKCHTNGDYSSTSAECVSCHETDFNQAVNPNHVELGLENQCETCHSTEPEWQPAGFPVHNEYYVLQGAHLAIASNCFDCHEGNYVNTPNTCFSCHQEEYNQTVDPPHVSAQFPTECQTCHTETAWEPSTFDHDGPYFPIYSGEHAGEWNTCTECHTNPSNFALFSCIDCHDHNQADMDEEHQGIGGYQYNSLACFECHPTGEGQGGFNHNSTNFPLTGAHTSVTCIECHESGYAGTSMICSDCHEADYLQSGDPNHQALGIPDNCENCHTTNPGWQPATFSIHDNYYPLTGAHSTISTDCFTCHQGNYINTPNSCASCHINNYNQTVNPNHLALAIPQECETCHTTIPGWQPATFPIHNNFYPLTGAHSAIANDCSVCHNGNYTNTPNECFGCHADDYNQTTDPNHAQAQFPTECETCHNQNAWEPSTFDHDGQYFPIYSGEHEDEWDACTDCHTDPNNYAVFSCLGCHLQPEMDDEHEGVSGYVYNSIACLNCHPDGGTIQGIFRKD
jgi:hypothetical protein